MIQRRLLVVLVAMTVAFQYGCSPPVDTNEIAADDHFARETIEVLRARGVEGIRPRLLKTTAALPGMISAVNRMRALLPSVPPDSVRLLGGDINAEGGTTRAKLEYIVGGQGLNSRVQIWIVRIHGIPYIETLRVTQEP